MLCFFSFFLFFSFVYSNVPLYPTVVDNSLFPSSFNLTWYDDFNTSTILNTSKWTIELGFFDNGYTLPTNVFIQNNNLYLKQGNDSCNGTGIYTQGRVHSTPFFGFGYFEARIQFPNSFTWHDSFFLTALQTFPSPFWNQEIDIVEVNTYNMYYFPQHFHCWTNGTSNQKSQISNTFWKNNINMPTTGNYSSLHNWHIFGLHWNLTHTETYIDGGRYLTSVLPTQIVVNPVNLLFTQYLWIDPHFLL